jgi:tetratricopeptide (TPR) repeat protein
VSASAIASPRRALGLALLAALLAARPAAADRIWEQAASDDAEGAARDVYTAWMREGDAYATQADVRSVSLRELEKTIASAVQAYRNAAAARPQAAEPYFQIGTLLHRHYACESDAPSPLCRPFRPSRAADAIAAWDAFEARAPLDPRVRDLLFARAILHTKLATPAHLEAATRDYEQQLAQDGFYFAEDRPRTEGNLAETYMMLGRIDDAIAMYREAVADGADATAAYGLAVALDRDDRGAQAQETIFALGREAVLKFKKDVTSGKSFFVPEGEVYYYDALIDEAFGFDDSALEAWERFLRSGAHPRYQPRAKAHRDALRARAAASHPATPAPPRSRLDRGRW